MKRLHIRWLVLLALLLCSPFAFIAYLTIAVPVDIPEHMRDEAARYWPAALAAGAIVLAAALLAFRSRGAAGAALRNAGDTPAAVGAPGLRPSAAVGVQSTPLLVIAAVAAISWALATMAAMHGMPLWAIVLVALLPWLPVLVAETIGKYQRYGVYPSSSR